MIPKSTILLLFFNGFNIISIGVVEVETTLFPTYVEHVGPETTSNDIDPMTSNVAPSWKDNKYNEERYVITESRLTEIRKLFMYPYYDRGGYDDRGDYRAEIHTQSPQIHRNLPFRLPFFGFRYNYTRVSINGYLEFSDPPLNFEYPLEFPVKEWPKKNDPSFIGIFYSKCRIGRLRANEFSNRNPGVYFRIEKDLHSRTDKMGVELRERLKWDIRDGIIGAESFSLKHALIVTWKNISFAGGIDNSLYKTNTFQMVLATDEVLTYAIFNYDQIEWTSHTEAGGDASSGDGGIPAFIGFNAGNGTRSYEYTPYSQQSGIRALVSSGWTNGFKGRHIFRIDENIVRGSCQEDVASSNFEWYFAPESGNMLGGTMVNITGPCFRPDDKIKCKFYTTEVNGHIINQNLAICVQPQLFAQGWIDFKIAVNNGDYKWKGKYYIESPSTASEKIFFKDESVHEISPQAIRFEWNRNNLTDNHNASVRISLWGYKETAEGPIFSYITEFAETTVYNEGYASIFTGEYLYSAKDNPNLEDFKFGFIQINLTVPLMINTYSSKPRKVGITPIIWSRPIPLGWYFWLKWKEMYWKSWPERLCSDWLKHDRQLINFVPDLPQCPCTLSNALVDKGRFRPDMDCDKDINPFCFYNKHAIHCVTTGSPTSVGSEQQCCYDRNGYLMLSFDQRGGSSPRRSHIFGSAPYNETTKVPTLSQWHNDIVPKYLCCLWQEESAKGCESLRYERRSSDDCRKYQSPGIATVYGYLHFLTFDDLEYTFSGTGEFVLVKSKIPTNNLEIQGRFEQVPPNKLGELRATQLTSIVARGNNSVVVEVQQRPKAAKWRYSLNVIVDNKNLYFDKPSLKHQRFKGVTVYTPSYILNQSEVIIMFDNGVGVEVVDDQFYMKARVFLPESFRNNTVGLFGTWNSNLKDDFTIPDGSEVDMLTYDPHDMESTYIDFGSKWRVQDDPDPLKGKSLFHRYFGKTSTSYINKSFRPVFKMRPEDILHANQSYNMMKSYAICPEDVIECLYDYAITLNKNVAHSTAANKFEIIQLQETTKRKIVSCGVLKTPRHGRKSNFYFTPGTIVRFECDENYVLIGDHNRTCQANGTWNTPEYGYTYCVV